MFGQKGHPILYRSTRLQNQKIYLPVYGRRYSKATTPGIYNAIILRVETQREHIRQGPCNAVQTGLVSDLLDKL